MKAEMRRALAQESFEQKIRKVGELIRLSAAVKARRVPEGNAPRPPANPSAVVGRRKC